MRCTLRFFFGSSPALARAFALATTCSGAWATTYPTVSKPARPARPAIWWNSRDLSTRFLWPSNFVNAVNMTVRMGTLMPTPRVSVPQITLSRPRWASDSTRRRYLGSIPAWCTPIPAVRYLRIVVPKPRENGNPLSSSAIWWRSSVDSSLIEVSDWARSTACFWEGWTM